MQHRRITFNLTKVITIWQAKKFRGESDNSATKSQALKWYLAIRLRKISFYHGSFLGKKITTSSRAKMYPSF